MTDVDLAEQRTCLESEISDNPTEVKVATVITLAIIDRCEKAEAERDAITEAALDAEVELVTLRAQVGEYLAEMKAPGITTKAGLGGSVQELYRRDMAHRLTELTGIGGTE